MRPGGTPPRAKTPVNNQTFCGEACDAKQLDAILSSLASKLHNQSFMVESDDETPISSPPHKALRTTSSEDDPELAVALAESMATHRSATFDPVLAAVMAESAAMHRTHIVPPKENAFTFDALVAAGAPASSRRPIESSHNFDGTDISPIEPDDDDE